MNEDDARAFLRNVPRETLSGVERFIDALIEENTRQNLIAASTIAHIWTRHVVDSAQLLHHAAEGSWLDLGSGAGFPGLIVAAIGRRPVSLVESRARRVAFLRRAAGLLPMASVEIIGERIERIAPRTYEVISARAFAPLDRLLTVALPFSTPATRWLLPKGRSAAAELETIRGSWQGDFRIEPSITDPESAIIVASDVRRAARR